MKDIVFATGNENKIKEVALLLSAKYRILGLKDIGCNVDIPETADTLEGNALIKANYVFSKYNKDCFSDDTGLEVEYLNGAPGIYSARYAGNEKNSEANIDKLLRELNGVKDRSARFRTVVALIIDGNKYFFEGIIKGEIITKRQGKGGFGYDAVFKPEGYDVTFAELSIKDKNKISHRAIVIRKLINFLSKH